MLALLLVAAALTPDPTFEEGVRLYRESSYEQAIFRFEEIAVRPGLAPSDKATALMWLGLSYAGTGDLDAAKRSFRFALLADVTAAIPTETSPVIVEMVEAIRSELASAAAREPDATKRAPEPPAPAPSTPSSPNIAVIGGGVAAGVGALAVISGGVLALIAADQLAQANDPDAFQDEAIVARDNAGATATAAVVVIPIGAVLGIAGGAVVVLNLAE